MRSGLVTCVYIIEGNNPRWLLFILLNVSQLYRHLLTVTVYLFYVSVYITPLQYDIITRIVQYV